MNPVPGYGITTPFGKRGPLWSLGFHTGADFAAPEGTPIVAAVAGTVIAANAFDKAYGYKVIISAGSEQHWYCHMPTNRAVVHVGQSVAAGARIGAVGSTGNVTGSHLHMERRVYPFTFAADNFRDPADLIGTQQDEDDMFTDDDRAMLEQVLKHLKHVEGEVGVKHGAKGVVLGESLDDKVDRLLGEDTDQ